MEHDRGEQTAQVGQRLGVGWFAVFDKPTRVWREVRKWMADLILRNLLKEIGPRLGAAAVVFGAFVSLGYASRTGVLGRSTFLGGRFTFSAAAFLLVGAVSLGWIAF